MAGENLYDNSGEVALELWIEQVLTLLDYNGFHRYREAISEAELFLY